MRIADDERGELDRDPAGEVVELAQLWEARGLTPDTARRVAEELSAHDALGAQLDAEYGIDEVMPPSAPLLAGVAGAIAFMIGASIPLLITWLAPVAIETWAIVISVAASLTLTSIIAARAGHLSLLRVLVRTLFVGFGTMGISYVAGLVLF